jgi:hypothetical protein
MYITVPQLVQFNIFTETLKKPQAHQEDDSLHHRNMLVMSRYIVHISLPAFGP